MLKFRLDFLPSPFYLESVWDSGLQLSVVSWGGGGWSWGGGVGDELKMHIYLHLHRTRIPAWYYYRCGVVSMVMEGEEMRQVSGEPETVALRSARLWWDGQDQHITVCKRRKKGGEGGRETKGCVWICSFHIQRSYYAMPTIVCIIWTASTILNQLHQKCSCYDQLYCRSTGPLTWEIAHRLQISICQWLETNT